MTPEQEAKHQDLKIRSRLAADRLQRIAEVLGKAAYLRELGVHPAENEMAKLKAYETTLKRMEELTDEEESLLRDAGILPKKPNK
jgi:predicted secreted protein